MQKVFLTFLIFIVLFSCKTLDTNSQKNKFYPKINSNKLHKIIKKSDLKTEYFSSKIRVIYNKQNFTAKLKIKQDSIILISLTGPFGIEGARIQILKNRFQMIDRMHRVYYDKPISFIKNYFPIDLNYKMLEQLIIGNFFENNLKKQKIETKDKKYIVKGNVPNLDILYNILANGKIENINIQEDNNKFKILANYSDFEEINNKKISLRRNYHITNELQQNFLDLKFYKINTDKQNFSFEKPKAYTNN